MSGPLATGGGGGVATAASIGLGNVENVALSTWTGSVNISMLGTVTSGVWNGTAIGDSYIASAATWNAKQAALVSGTNIKTVGGVSLLGSGNVDAVMTTGDQTVGGEKTLTGQLQLSGSQAARDANSAMSRGLVDLECMLDTRYAQVMITGSAVSAGAGAGALYTVGVNMTTPITAAGYSATSFGEMITNLTSATGTVMYNGSAAEIMLQHLSLRIPNDGTVRMRIMIGVGAQTRTPPASDAAPLTSRGLGCDIYWSTANSRVEGRIFYYDTTVVYGSAFAWPTSVADDIGTRMQNVLLTWDPSTGTIAVYASPQAASGRGALRLPNTPTASVSGVTFTNAYFGGRGYQVEIANHSTTAASAISHLKWRRTIVGYNPSA